MKKENKNGGRDPLRTEYNLAKLRGGVRGKYYKRYHAGTNLVLLAPDVAKVFPDGDSVNAALRALIGIAKAQVKRAV